MRDFLFVAAAFIVAVIGASAVAWPLYAWLTLETWVEFTKFAKWFALLTVAVATVAVLKHRGRLHWPDVGFTSASKPVPYLLSTGFAAGLVMLASLGVAFLFLGVRVADAGSSPAEITFKLIFSIIPAALAVSLIEETYFRGVQFEALARERRTAAAVILPAAFYMIVHFLNPQEPAGGAEPDWFHGVALVLSAPAEICRTSDCVGAAAALFIAGALLSLVRLLGGHLLVCVGIHAGWIAGIKLTKQVSNFDRGADLAFLAGGHDRFIGVLAALWLAVPCIWLIRRLIKNT